jgi:ribosomal protein S18 acetylase RimI-like enzyme
VSLTIRDAGPGDIDALAAIWHEGWHDAHAAILPPELTRVRTLDSFRDRIREALHTVRVADSDGIAVGFIMLKGDELYQIYVASRARGSGAAVTLMADAEARIKAAGFVVAWLACAVGNDRAARFYEKSGWQRTGVVRYDAAIPGGAYNLEVWRYERQLSEGGT